jgi:Inositol-pentakisphosphate 2-kinase
LLRLAKRNRHTLPILKKHQAVQDVFLPLLTTDNGEQLVVHTDLVRISAPVLQTLQCEQVCTNTKRDSRLDLEETHGTLLEDLSADPSILLLDFKVCDPRPNSLIEPKWLSQSPTAPLTATTCRTCALRRLRRKPPKSKPRFCPLDLSSGRYPRVHRAVTALLHEKQIHNEVNHWSGCSTHVVCLRANN